MGLKVGPDLWGSGLAFFHQFAVVVASKCQMIIYTASLATSTRENKNLFPPVNPPNKFNYIALMCSVETLHFLRRISLLGPWEAGEM
jgi:hypothetical protein